APRASRARSAGTATSRSTRPRRRSCSPGSSASDGRGCPTAPASLQSRSMTDAFGVEVSEEGRRATLSGEFDMESYDAVADVLMNALSSDGEIVLDLSDVSFVDSSAIRLFAQLHRARGDGGRLVLVSPQPQVARVLEVAGLRDIGISIQETDGA